MRPVQCKWCLNFKPYSEVSFKHTSDDAEATCNRCSNVFWYMIETLRNLGLTK